MVVPLLKNRKRVCLLYAVKVLKLLTPIIAENFVLPNQEYESVPLN